MASASRLARCAVPVRRHPGPLALDRCVHDTEVEGSGVHAFEGGDGGGREGSGRSRFRCHIGGSRGLGRPPCYVRVGLFREEEISSVDQMCPPAEHLIRVVDLLSGLRCLDRMVMVSLCTVGGKSPCVMQR
jgi:hypothetical protein